MKKNSLNCQKKLMEKFGGSLNNFSKSEKQNILEMKRQLKLMGLSIDWDLEISTCNKDYYKHQQELFIDFYNQGLVSRKETYVCLLYTSPSPRDKRQSRMPSSA